MLTNHANAADELRILVEKQGGEPHVSLYMPTVRAGPETRQNPIRCKNLVRDVVSQLQQRGLRPPDIDALIEPISARIDDYDYWQHQEDGLAMFLGPGFFREYCLPLRFGQLAVVENRFHLKPLFPLLSGDGTFFILALSQNKVRLLEGSRYSVSEIPLDDVPDSLASALGQDVTEQHLQFHTPAGSAPVYHAQGGGTDDVKPEIRKFFSLLDKGLKDYLGSDNPPLVLAGVEYLLPIYRDASGYPNIAGEGVTGNPDELAPDLLHSKAWPLVEHLFDALRNSEEEQYHELAHKSQASNQLRDVVLAAHDGRVQTLFVAKGVRHWGRFDIKSREIQFMDALEDGGEDLLDLAAVRTFLNGGKVFVVEPDDVPGSKSVAAVFRY